MRMEKISVRIGAENLAALKKIAEEQDIPVGFLVRRLINTACIQWEKNKIELSNLVRSLEIQWHEEQTQDWHADRMSSMKPELK